MLSGLERRLARLVPHTGIALPSGVKRIFSYADDVKLIAGSSCQLNEMFGVVSDFLAMLGLHCDPGKCSVMPICAPNVLSVLLGGGRGQCVRVNSLFGHQHRQLG